MEQQKFDKGNLLAMISTSFDMGWNKRSSGNRYDSLSGHTLSIGCLSNNILYIVVSSKICRQCSITKENGKEPPEHVYPQNYDGSSKAMEVDAALTLFKDIYNKSDKKIILKQLSPMKIHLCELCSSIDVITRKVDYQRK